MDPAFARLYAAYAELDAEDLPLWRRLAHQQGEPILELGCGAGRILLDLARHGFHPLGLDRQWTLLRLAQRRLQRAGHPATRLLQGDMRRFHLDLRCALILVACNTLANLDDRQVLHTLQCIQRHLAPQGLAAFDLPNEPLANARQPWSAQEPLAIFQDPESGHPVQVYARQSPAGPPNAVAVDWVFDELLPDGQVRRHTHQLVYHLRSVDRYRRLLLEAGLPGVTVHGDYDLAPYGPDSPRTILLARPSPAASR